MKIDLYLTPIPFGKVELEHKTVVIIDVLRSTTSICAALQAGAKAIIPTERPGEAGDMLAKIGRDITILAGEKNGVKIDNFQLGNSPAEFTSQAVGGKYVIMTTTNGTGIFSKTYNASTVIAGALVNIAVVAERIVKENNDLVIVCAGREGHFSIEDTICGGMLIHQVGDTFHIDYSANDAGKLALLLYQTNQAKLRQTIEQGEHAKFLASLGYANDIIIATNVDSIPVLPILKDGQLISETTYPNKIA